MLCPNCTYSKLRVSLNYFVPDFEKPATVVAVLEETIPPPTYICYVRFQDFPGTPIASTPYSLCKPRSIQISVGCGANV